MPVVELKKEELPYEMNEEFKLLRTNIQFSGTDKKVLLLTSAFSGEGKSTVALELCRSFTELGKTVLLIDADMRNSALCGSLTAQCLNLACHTFYPTSAAPTTCFAAPTPRA